MADEASRGRSPTHAAIFAPLEPAGRVEQVTRRLSDAIALGLLRDGERLPSESELALALGVSTVTVRESLVGLRQQELVETRRGRGGGSFVRAPADPASALLRCRLEELSLGDLRDLCDHYAAISGAAARLASSRADDDDIDRLQRSIETGMDASEPGARRRAEGQFHLDVVAAAQSARLTREEIRLQSEVGPLLWVPAGNASTARSTTSQHAEITARIRYGDGSGARAAAEEHVAEALGHVIALHRTLSRTRRG